MASVNKAIIVGRLGQDPEIRSTQNGSNVANLSVATSERYRDKSGQTQEQTEWHRITLWGKLADVASNYLRKGSQVYIEGKIQTRKWTDKDGVDRYTTEINGFSLQMLDSKNQTSTQEHKSQGSAQISSLSDSDSDLPF